MAYLHDAEALFQEIASGKLISSVIATTLTDIFYIARRQTQSIESARKAIVMTLVCVEICPADRAVLELALSSSTYLLWF